MHKRIAKFLFRFAVFVLGLVVVCTVVRSYAVRGFLWPVRIAGGSMAPSLFGDHVRVACGDCGFTFSFGVESPPDEDRATCPNCGFSANNVAGKSPRRGQRVLIDRASWRAGFPRRWRVIAIRETDGLERLAVKRVVGLPGERVAIRGGEIYIDGRILRKSLDQFRRMAVLVHDNNYQPHPRRGLPPRWAAKETDSCWKTSDEGHSHGAAKKSRDRSHGGFQLSCSSSGALSQELDWLVYSHLPGLPPPAARTGPTPVYDHYGYNQAASRSLNEVRDLLLQLRVSLSRSGELAVLGDDGAHRWEVRISVGQAGDSASRENDADERAGEAPAEPPEGNAATARPEPRPPETRITLRRDGRIVCRTVMPPSDWTRPRWVEFAMLDGRILLGVDGRIVLIHEKPIPTQPATDPRRVAEPFAIGGAVGEVQVSHLRVYRDLYFLHPWGGNGPWEMPETLSHDEIFVLGDNCPVSEDSRNWPQPGLPLRNVQGFVVPVE